MHGAKHNSPMQVLFGPQLQDSLQPSAQGSGAGRQGPAKPRRAASAPDDRRAAPTVAAPNPNNPFNAVRRLVALPNLRVKASKRSLSKVHAPLYEMMSVCYTR
jgi:hypothetical protein